PYLTRVDSIDLDDFEFRAVGDVLRGDEHPAVTVEVKSVIHIRLPDEVGAVGPFYFALFHELGAEYADRQVVGDVVEEIERRLCDLLHFVVRGVFWPEQHAYVRDRPFSYIMYRWDLARCHAVMQHADSR